MINHNFLNWNEALRFMFGSSDPAVIGALSQINKGIQRCAGLPVNVTSIGRCPSQSLDLLWLYHSVADIISNWNILENLRDKELEFLQSYLNDPLLPEVDQDGQMALMIFSYSLLKLQKPTSQVDISFCVWLFAETIIAPDLLTQVLDGSIARILADQSNFDFDTWAATWT